MKLVVSKSIMSISLLVYFPQKINVIVDINYRFSVVTKNPKACKQTANDTICIDLNTKIIVIFPPILKITLVYTSLLYTQQSSTMRCSIGMHTASNWWLVYNLETPTHKFMALFGNKSWRRKKCTSEWKKMGHLDKLQVISKINWSYEQLFLCHTVDVLGHQLTQKYISCLLQPLWLRLCGRLFHQLQHSCFDCQ